MKKDVQYQKLCGQILDILLGVLSSLPPLALHEEPEDCLNAFEDFIVSLIKQSNYLIDSPEKAQALIALVGLCISRAQAKDLLLVANVLFHTYKSMGPASAFQLKIGSYLKQLAEHRLDQEISILFERGLKGKQSNEKHQKQQTS
jgi:hypothetical protein